MGWGLQVKAQGLSDGDHLGNKVAIQSPVHRELQMSAEAAAKGPGVMGLTQQSPGQPTGWGLTQKGVRGEEMNDVWDLRGRQSTQGPIYLF